MIAEPQLQCQAHEWCRLFTWKTVCVKIYIQAFVTGGEFKQWP
jgi:hypothetical protein